MSESIADLTPSKVLGRMAKFQRLLEEDGLPWEAFQWPIDDLEMRRRLVSFWASGCYEQTISQKLTREIMGRNFFGIREAVRHFGINPLHQQLTDLSEVPFSENVLQACKDTHILVAVFPLSILDIRKKVERNLFYSHDDAWYNNQAFAKEKGETSWHLIRKDIVSESTSKTWQEQQALLAEKEGVPSAQVMIYTIIGHYKSSGERLFEKVYARCQCFSSDGYRVSVGRFGSAGLCVVNCWGVSRRDSFGLASSLKIQSLNT